MPLAISKEKTWEKLRYKPHAAQTPIHRSQARFRVNAAGRRTGKSTAGGHELVPEAILTRTMQARLEDLGRRREFWIVGPEYSDSEKEFRVFWDDCKRLGIPFDKPGSYYNPLAGDLQVSLCKGRFLVIGKSAKYPATLVGEGLSGVIMAEAAKVKSQVWTKFVRPTLADYKGWALFNSTPEGRNWFYHLWQQGRNPDFTGWESWRHPSWMNDILFPAGRQDEEILAMEREMTAELFQQEVAADFSEFVGKVFKDFDEETHVKKLSFNPDWQTYACCDYGWTNPFVWLLLQVGPNGTVHVMRELYQTQKDPIELSDMIKRRGLAPTGLIAFYPDPAEPQDTAILSRRLQVRARINGGGELRDRLDLIRKGLRKANPDDDKSEPRLLVDHSCTELINEMNIYRYPENKSEMRNNAEEPMDRDNHGPEALGRFYKGYFGQERTNSRITRATVNA
jgi:hypothetical protein